MTETMIYLDNAATTKIDPDVLDLLVKSYQDNYANPSSTHTMGSRAKARLEEARSKIAGLLAVSPKEIYFTSGATEASNWAIKGHDSVITSKIDHKASINSALKVKDHRFLQVDGQGLISLKDLDSMLNEKKSLVSIILANNETGIVQDYDSISEIARKYGAPIHYDCVQALGKIDLRGIDADMVSLSAHKIHGPKGIGLLYIREGITFPQLLDGGSQEMGRRAGTNNLAAVEGFALAMEKAVKNRQANVEKVLNLRDHFEKRLKSEIKDIKINSQGSRRLPNISSISLKGVDASQMLIMLDMRGICLSRGSACTSGSTKPSHVLQAMGLDESYLKGSLRVSLSTYTSLSEIDQAADAIIDIYHKLSK